ncbi:MAG: rhodanese-like domain-containing protein [Pseudomonadota bacterium]
MTYRVIIVLTLLLSSCHSSDAELHSTTVRVVEPAEASAVITEDETIVILDIRTPAEFADAHIENAVNIDFSQSDFATKVMALDKQKTYLVYCRSGRRSTLAMETFEDAMLTQVLHLADGLNGWQAAALPVVKEKRDE